MKPYSDNHEEDNVPEFIQEYLACLSLVNQALETLESDGIVNITTYSGDEEYTSELIWDTRELVFRISGDYSPDKSTCDTKHYKIIVTIMTHYAAKHLRMVLMDNGKTSAVPILIGDDERPPKGALL